MLTAREAELRRCIVQGKEEVAKAVWAHLTPDLQTSLAALQLGVEERTAPSLFDSTHYSWWLPFLEQVAGSPFYLAVFPQHLQEKIEQHLNLLPRPVPEWTYPFFKRALLAFLTQDDPHLLSISCLPNDPLNTLLDLNYTKLVALLDLLSLHDLAVELRTLVHAKNLKKIERLVTPKQRQFLRHLMLRPEPVAFAPLGLNRWDGNVDKLKSLLHVRGLNRLAKALVPSHPSLVWHLSHHLDVGRAEQLSAHLKDMHNKHAHDILRKQVLEGLGAYDSIPLF